MTSTKTAQLLDNLAQECKLLGLSLEDALKEKTAEISLRVFLKCIPNPGIKPTQLRDFVTEALGHSPPPWMLERLRIESRGTRIDNEEFISLENRQGGRCALCGRILLKMTTPQVDHIIPIALGGKNEITNYQLLCKQCNIGKSKLTGWIMGAPFLRENQGEPSFKIRYCVLSRHEGRCNAENCTETSRTSEIHVTPIIPVQRGGRLIFDNLTTLCSAHHLEHLNTLKQQAITKLRKSRYGISTLDPSPHSSNK